MMDNYNVSSNDEHFNGDIEKGKLNAKLSDNHGVFGSNIYNCGLGLGFVSNKHEEKAIPPLVNTNIDDDLKSLRVIVVDKSIENEENNGDVERKLMKEKSKKMSAKKPPKPPRPPRGFSLDSTDQKLIRELHEIARLKRARIERMKALKKAKETKTGSSKNQLFAALLSVLFCLVLLLQGISSRTSAAVTVRGPPFSSEVVEQQNIISVRHYPFSSTAKLSRRGSKSPRLVERVSDVGASEQVRKADG